MKGESLKKQREKAGITQHTLASMTGIGRYVISMIETGHRPIKKAEAEIFKNAFKSLKSQKV